MICSDLVEAVEDGNCAGLATVMREEPECAGQQCPSGAVLLHVAAEEGRLDIVELLLPITPEPATTQDKTGATPLHLAAMRGHKAIIQALLPVHSSSLAVDRSGSTAMHYAAGNGQKDAVVALLSAPDGAEAAKMKTKGGQTPAMLAKLNGFRDLSKLLKQVHSSDE